MGQSNANAGASTCASECCSQRCETEWKPSSWLPDASNSDSEGSTIEDTPDADGGLGGGRSGVKVEDQAVQTSTADMITARQMMSVVSRGQRASTAFNGKPFVHELGACASSPRTCSVSPRSRQGSSMSSRATESFAGRVVMRSPTSSPLPSYVPVVSPRARRRPGGVLLSYVPTPKVSYVPSPRGTTPIHSAGRRYQEGNCDSLAVDVETTVGALQTISSSLGAAVARQRSAGGRPPVEISYTPPKREGRREDIVKAKMPAPNATTMQIGARPRRANPRCRRTTLGTLHFLERKRSTLGTADMGIPNPLDVLLIHAQLTDGGDTAMRKRSEDSQFPSRKVRADSSKAKFRPTCPRGSLGEFAEPSQTAIIFDWDDTLFPTNYMLYELEIDCRLPLSQQAWKSASDEQDVATKLYQCESHALEILRRSFMRGHVALVTLAQNDWVERSCRLWYPRVGEFLGSRSIPVLYAQDLLQDSQKTELRARCESEEEFYGLMKGRAIAREVDQFYKQYPGQSWKNVVSIGDSRFERYGLLAASTAYMEGKRLSFETVHPQLPTEKGAWTKFVNDKEIQLRVKSCKLVDGPCLDELSIEIQIVSRWLDLMVKVPEGFDVDFESFTDMAKVNAVETMLQGKSCYTDLLNAVSNPARLPSRFPDPAVTTAYV